MDGSSELVAANLSQLIPNGYDNTSTSNSHLSLNLVSLFDNIFVRQYMQSQCVPAAKAALALRVIIACGKFHGVMRAATPIGSRVKRICFCFCGLGTISP